MSQRCLISFRKNITSNDHFYDCIYDENGNLEILLRDWLGMDKEHDFCLGPWKLNIRDKELFSDFMKNFFLIKNYCPKFKSLNDCWAIFIDGVSIYDNPPEWFENVIKSIMTTENS